MPVDGYANKTFARERGTSGRNGLCPYPCCPSSTCIAALPEPSAPAGCGFHPSRPLLASTAQRRFCCWLRSCGSSAFGRHTVSGAARSRRGVAVGSLAAPEPRRYLVDTGGTRAAKASGALAILAGLSFGSQACEDFALQW